MISPWWCKRWNVKSRHEKLRPWCIYGGQDIAKRWSIQCPHEWIHAITTGVHLVPALSLPPSDFSSWDPDFGFSGHQRQSTNDNHAHYTSPKHKDTKVSGFGFLWRHFYQRSSICGTGYFWELPPRSRSCSPVTSTSPLCSTVLCGIGSSSC